MSKRTTQSSEVDIALMQQELGNFMERSEKSHKDHKETLGKILDQALLTNGKVKENTGFRNAVASIIEENTKFRLQISTIFSLAKWLGAGQIVALAVVALKVFG